MKLNKEYTKTRNSFRDNTEYRILANRAYNRIYTLEKLSLAERKQARSRWVEAMKNEEIIEGIIEGLFIGEYGEEEYYAACLIMCMNANANHAAKFGELIAGVEYGCPPSFARSGWKMLSIQEQANVNAAVLRAAAKWFLIKVLEKGDK